jgi:hypothetical protein
MSTLVPNLTFIARLHCCAWSSRSWLLTTSRMRLAPFVKRWQVSSCCRWYFFGANRGMFFWWEGA